MIFNCIQYGKSILVSIFLQYCWQKRKSSNERIGKNWNIFEYRILPILSIRNAVICFTYNFPSFHCSLSTQKSSDFQGKNRNRKLFGISTTRLLEIDKLVKIEICTTKNTMYCTFTLHTHLVRYAKNVCFYFLYMI